MIIRKPYAFLIKNFRKIHIVLLVLSLYLTYKIIDVNSFVNEFMNLGTYDLFADPITRHISTFMTLSVIIMIVGSAALLLLLRYKGKPWKIYLIPFISYLSLFFILNIIKSFFNTYTIDVDAADLRFSKDLLLMFTVVQLPIIGIFLMRTFGLDIKKFNFNGDEEFLELSDEDREEIEISLDIDVNSFKRFYRKILRNINYFYLEHKLISRTVIGFLIFLFIFNVYSFVFVTHKSYSEGDIYRYGNFNIRIDNSYVSDKDYKGDVISKKNKFVIVKFKVKNTSEYSKKLNTSNFHVKAGNIDYVTTETTFADEFYDLGNTFSKVKEFNGGETIDFIVIYKVDKKINNNRFVLFYQEKNNDNILRKIKLKITDLSKVEKEKDYKFGDIFSTNVIGNNDKVSIDDFELIDEFDYSSKRCASGDCTIGVDHYNVDGDHKVLMLDFGTMKWEAKEISTYLKKNARIMYENEEGISKDVEVEMALKRNYIGKVAYIKVLKEIENAKNIKLHIVSRNKEFDYMLS